MKKRTQTRKFSRPEQQRKAMFNILASQVFLAGRIKTTEAKAKELRIFAEKLLTKAKQGDLSARRHVLRFLDKKSAKKLIEEIAPKYKSRQGGYFRVIKLQPRAFDGAKMAIIELVE